MQRQQEEQCSCAVVVSWPQLKAWARALWLTVAQSSRAARRAAALATALRDTLLHRHLLLCNARAPHADCAALNAAITMHTAAVAVITIDKQQQHDEHHHHRNNHDNNVAAAPHSDWRTLLLAAGWRDQGPFVIAADNCGRTPPPACWLMVRDGPMPAESDDE